MTAVIVESSYGKGRVDAESWSNPKTFLVDICLEDGYTMPEYKDKLIYKGTEEY